MNCAGCDASWSKSRVEFSRISRPWETVEVARHPDRPMTTDYLELVCDEFVELHGDKSFGDDRAIRTGFAKLDQFKVLFVGHQKGRTVKERSICHFGCAHPEGYRKAMAKMRLAAKFGRPVICADRHARRVSGRRGRGARPIASHRREHVPDVATSDADHLRRDRRRGLGRALGIGIGDKVAVLEHAYYSVISPEGCAGILWKSHTHKEQAAKTLRLTSRDLLKLGVIDDVIDEPLGGAHRDYPRMAARLKMYLLKSLRELTARPLDELLAALRKVPPDGTVSRRRPAGARRRIFDGGRISQILRSRLPSREFPCLC